MEENNYIVYVHICPNNKKYIGITNNPKKRWENHKCNNDPTMVIAKAIQKYGKDNFEFKIFKVIPGQKRLKYLLKFPYLLEGQSN